MKPCCPRLRSISCRIFFHRTKSHLSTAAKSEKPSTRLSSYEENPEYPSSLKFSGIARTVISKCSNLWGAGEDEVSSTASLKDYVLSLSSICPHIVRRFWRVSFLKPQDVLEILLGFESERDKNTGAVRKAVGPLWGIFMWASRQSREFVHSPQSCKIMSLFLVQNGYFKEAEYLLSREESQEILLDCEEIFSHLIEGYLGVYDLEKGLLVYERMRRLNLVPSYSIYKAILRYLIELNETKLMYDFYLDFIKMGMRGNIEESSSHENIIRLLCVDGKVQEARDLVRRTMSFGIKPCHSVVKAISSGYCDKKDYNDLLSFLAEARISPDVKLGNKILFSFCSNYGIDQANVFLQQLEEMNFLPDEITFGILIGYSCRQGKLKNALVYFSDVQSKGLKPNVYSYNALLSGMFVEGMWKHARDIFLDMKDTGTSPDWSTYRVLLAGFCKARQFDEAKAIVSEMIDHDFINLSPLEDLLTKAFTILGLSSSSVNIKRDNDKGLSKTEFFDSLGNGLYLDTDTGEYEKAISSVLEDAFLPDFNSSIVEKTGSSDIKCIWLMVDEMQKWGQELSSSAFASLINRFRRGPFSIKNITYLMSIISKSVYQLDCITLNTLILIYSKKGFTFKARLLFDGMVKRGRVIENSSYSALLCDICRKGDLKSFHYSFDLARKSNWCPEAKDCNALLRSLFQNKWMNEAFGLFALMLSGACFDILDVFHSLLEGLCSQGFTTIAHALSEEFSKNGVFLDGAAYGHLVSGFCREKRFMEALCIFDHMLSLNLFPPVDVCAQMIFQLSYTNIDKAVELRNLLTRNQPRALIPINRALINGLCKSGRVEKAARLFQEVSLENSILRLEVYNALIEGYCEQNNFEKVKHILAVMIRKNVSISVYSYSKMVRLACMNDKFHLATGLKELMFQMGDVPELVLYNIVIFHVSSMRAHDLLDELVSSLRRKDIHFDEVTYNYIIRGFLLCEDTSRSLHYLSSMISQELKPRNRTLRKIITLLRRDGREMELRGWDFSIPNNTSYDYLIERLYRRGGGVDESAELLNAMLRKGSTPESTSYDYIILGLCGRREWDDALDYYTEMLHRGLMPSLATLETLVCGLSGGGRAEEGEKIVKSMVFEFGKSPRREVLEALVDGYASKNNKGKVFEVVRLIQQMGYELDFDAHWSLIGNLSEKHEKSGFLSRLLSGFGVAQNKRGYEG